MEVKEQHYKRIFLDNYARVLRVCTGYVAGDEALAKDLAQETFLKIWQHLEGFRNESALETWIYRICVNTCLMALRKEKRLASFERLEHGLANENATEPEENELKLVRMYACINNLNSTNKAIILLELEGLPQLEISEIIGINHEAVRTRIHRIKNQLTKCVRHE